MFNHKGIMPRLLKVTGLLSRAANSGEVEYVAAAPPDARASFSGSALPFANPTQAFENTPSKGVMRLADDRRTFEVQIHEPNSFYTDLGTVLIAPSLFVKYVAADDGSQHMDRILLGEPIAYRTLTYPNNDSCRPRASPEFYAPGEVVDYPRTQEEIFLDGTYQEKCAKGFWGKRPPN
jgi:hypothetical protein